MKMIIKYGRKTITWFSMVTLMSMVFVEMIGVLFPVFELQASGTAEITSYLGALTIAFCIFWDQRFNSKPFSGIFSRPISRFVIQPLIF